MSITDELRKWLKSLYTPNSATVKDEGERIADRIDAEHQKALDEWKAKQGQMWLKGYSECHAELLEGNETLASDLERCGWIRLPKDADDVPWNVGDRDEDGNEVIALKLATDGWYVITVGEWPYRPERKRHYHAPTVEDVLREFANGWDFAEGIGNGDSYIKTFAAKLRLAEGEDA